MGKIDIILVPIIVIGIFLILAYLIRRLEKSPKVVDKQKVYTFSVIDKAIIGDLYIYEIPAESREAAAQFLIRHFFDEDKSELPEIKSDHRHVTWSGGHGSIPRTNQIFDKGDAMMFSLLISSGPPSYASEAFKDKYRKWREEFLNEHCQKPRI